MSSVCPKCRRTYKRSTGLCPEDGTELVALEKSGLDDPLAGLVLDEQYRLESLLGAGGMGKVYRATQLAVEREVAVKVLRADLTESQDAHRRFSTEAQTISSLTHPNVVQLIDFGTDERHDILYLVMEYVQGRHLASLLKEGRLAPNLALEVLYQVCGGLAEPHSRGLVHRDLKPDNVQLVAMADGTIQAKVLDFGIVRCVEQTNRLTTSGVVCGTPAYLSPEQARGRPVDPRSDLYSLGVMLFEMLTGRLPFRASRGFQLMLKHIREAPPSLGEFISEERVVELVEPLAEQMMAKTLEERPDGVGAVRKRIEAIREELGLPIHRLPGEYTDVDELEEEVYSVDHGDLEASSEGAIRETDSVATTAGVYETIAPTLEPDDVRDAEKLAPLGSNMQDEQRSSLTEPIEVEAAQKIVSSGRGTQTAFPPHNADSEQLDEEEVKSSGAYVVGPTRPEEPTEPEQTRPGESVSASESSVWFRRGAFLGVAVVAVSGVLAWIYEIPGGKRAAAEAEQTANQVAAPPTPGAGAGMEHGTAAPDGGETSSDAAGATQARDDAGTDAGTDSSRADSGRSVASNERVDSVATEGPPQEERTEKQRASSESVASTDQTDETTDPTEGSRPTRSDDPPARRREPERDPRATRESESGSDNEQNVDDELMEAMEDLR